ncbi:MAG TPA: (2Fe-2S)-binding protein [Chloroflexi bacterium]|jgi:carbon-monoxide dehydrogenase small subunit|nr:(2Fe-2S)-binding protein [Chloroflexota bacterium]
MKIEVTVNGESQEWEVPVNQTLLDALRLRGLPGTKRVCESGECGACAVIVDGLALDSCILLAVQAAGMSIVTVEGLSTGSQLHPVQEAFTQNGAIQCGFCIPGMIVTAANYLEENPSPTQEEIRHVFVGNLCRCTGYKKPIEAVLSAVRDDDTS